VYGFVACVSTKIAKETMPIGKSDRIFRVIYAQAMDYTRCWQQFFRYYLLKIQKKNREKQSWAKN
jgi:hypothetical protein